MTDRYTASIGVLAVAIAVGAVSSISLAGQTRRTAGAERPASGTPKAVGKTPDGQPDVQGFWVFRPTGSFQGVGAARRRRSGEKIPGESVAIVTAQGRQRFAAVGEDGDDPKPGRPAQVVYPLNGVVPIRPSAEAELDHLKDLFYDSYVYNNPGERCITRGVPASAFTGQGAKQIVQGPGFVSIISEWYHDARLIPLDGSPHLPQSVRLWDGDSRGHWEGNTLVVDVTNYNNKGSVTNHAGAGNLQGMRQSEALHVVERYTVVDADTINYEVTIDDPNVYTEPWKVAIPVKRVTDPDYKMFEYGCHEGNVIYTETVLRTGRLMDQGPEAVAAAESASRKAIAAATKAEDEAKAKAKAGK